MSARFSSTTIRDNFVTLSADNDDMDVQGSHRESSQRDPRSQSDTTILCSWIRLVVVSGLMITVTISAIVYILVYLRPSTNEIPPLQHRDEAENENTRLDTPGRCGGVIEISGQAQRDLIYTKNYNQSDEEEICIWLIKTKNFGGMELTLVNSVDLLPLNVSESRLVVSHGHTVNSSVISLLGNTTKLDIDDPFIILWFYSKSSSSTTTTNTTTSSQGKRLGFHIQLREKNAGVHRKLQYVWTEVTQNSPRTVQYTQQTYDSRVFTWVKAEKNKRVQLTLENVYTEKDHDGFQIFGFNTRTRAVTMDPKYSLSGHLGKLSGMTFTGGVNQPLLVYFHTDDSDESIFISYNGYFKFSFKYVR